LEKFTINSENLKNIHNACGHWLNAAHEYQDATHQKEIDQVKRLHRLTYVLLMQLKYSTPSDSEDQAVSETITPVDIFSQLKIYIESKINGDQIKSDSLKELLYLLDDENMDLSPAIKLIKIQEIAERYRASTVHNIYRMFSHIGNRAAIEESSWLRELFSRIKNTNLLRDGSENDNETYQKATLSHLGAYLKAETADDNFEVVYQFNSLRMI
jgi:hypothetical protein